MPRRVAAAVIAGLCLAAGASGRAYADEGGHGRTTAGAESSPTAIAAMAGMEATGGGAASGASVSRPRCTWEKFNFNVTEDGRPEGDTTLIRDAATKAMVQAPSQMTETLYERSCPGQAPMLMWVSDGVRAEDLISSALHRVRAQIPLPAMNMNPDPSVGGIVNIGLWLAVQDPGQVSITASVGPVWAAVTARYERTVWEMGNGDWVECAGLGTPIVDWDTVEQGPCGYTYGWPSAPKFTGTDDLAYHASVTGHWVITFATSSGGSGSLAPIARTTDFTYQVREIQTVRVAADG